MTQEAPGSIDDEAIRWFVLLQDEDATEEDRLRWRAWRSASPEHERAWLEVARIWGGLDMLAEEHAPRREKTPAAPPQPSSNDHHARLPSRRMASMAAAMVLAVALAWQLAPVGWKADYASGTGERRIVRLDDGSQVELGAASAMDVDYSSGRRMVRLLSGEAFFTVTGDAARPFVVAAGEGQVKVLGTAFNVKIRDGEVTVAVAHNTVEVSAHSGPGVKVTEGETVHYDRNGVSPVAVADLVTVAAWRNDQLVFKDEPLDAVLAELGRYRHGHIRLLNETAGDRRVTAVFDTRKTDEALDTIAASLGLRVYRATNLLVAIAGK